MEEHLPRRHVAQRRREEHAAVLRLVPHVGAIRAANAEIEIRLVAVRRQSRIARRAERLELAVGEQRRQAVRAWLIQMTAAAIRLVRIVEQPVAAQLLLASAAPCPPARSRTCWCRDESSGPRSDSARPRTAPPTPPAAAWRTPRRRTAAPSRARRAHAAASPPPRDAAAVHLDRAEQRAERLILQRVGAAVPEQAALRHDVGRRRRRVRAVFFARGACCPTTASCVRLTVSFSSLSGPMLKLGCRSRYISEGTARTP